MPSHSSNSGPHDSDSPRRADASDLRSPIDAAAQQDDGPQDDRPQDGRPNDQNSNEIAARAVKTFEFEVSAGRSAKLSATLATEISAALSAVNPAALPAVNPAALTPVIASERPALAADVRLQSPTVAKPNVETTAPLAELGNPLIDSGATITNLPSEPPVAADTSERLPATTEPSAKLAPRSSGDITPAADDVVVKQVDVTAKALLPVWLARRQSSWWIVSLGLHVVLLFVLAFSTLIVIREQEQLELTASLAVYDAVEEFVDLEVDPADELESLEEESASELDEPAELSEAAEATFADLSSETLFDQATISESTQSESAAVELTGRLGEMGQVFGENGSGMRKMGSGMVGATAKFFGAEVKARRILYMLDNSGGMLQGGKFESLVSELQASVNVLDAKQRFYVIFFSDTVYPLFYPQSVREFMPATERNRQQLQRWLESVELCTGNAIDEALAAAEVIRPDAVFLLTDGNLFTTEKKKAQLLDRSGRQYSIHTFGLGVGEQTQTAEGLKQIAEANEGTFRVIKVSAEAKQLAKEKQRPYHSKLPGPVWGLQVGLR